MVQSTGTTDVIYACKLGAPWLFFSCAAVLLVCAWYRWNYYRPITYVHSLTQFLLQRLRAHSRVPRTIMFMLRLAALLLLSFVIAQPRLVDVASQVKVEGVDIVIALDVSGSMQLFDDPHDQRSRITVAKQEAKRFIDQRDNDPMGLVLFGNAAISRCPLTLDKTMLHDIIDDIKLGVIDEQGTHLASGLVVAANRLAHSGAKSKIIILITDGEPQGDSVEIEDAINVLQQVGVKVYTIGIGNERGAYHPMYGLVPMGGMNAQILKQIARETGGTFFEARKPNELRQIYQTIDELEKTSSDLTVFSNYLEWYTPWLAFALGLFACEKILAALVWTLI